MAGEAAVVLAVPQVKLLNGSFMPAVGLGTWLAPAGEVQKAVRSALACGYRHIDCAAIYGNEAEVGVGLQESGVPRSEVFLTSKLWNSEHDPADVEPACRASIEKLGCGYLDLYLMHWPLCMRKGAPLPPGKEDFTDIPIEDTWRAMEALVEKGLCKAIGVSNFSAKKMERLLTVAKAKPAVNQVEGHPYLQQPALKQLCDAHGIVITAYSPLGSPERPARVKDAADPVLLEDPTLAELAKRLGRTPADVCLRWGVQRGTAVIPKSINPARIEQNLRLACVPLPEDAMEVLSGMDQHLRLFKGWMWCPEGTTGPVKTPAALWDE